MYCLKCGAEIKDHARYCVKCGQEIAPIKGAVKKKKPGPRRLLWLWILLALLVLIGSIVSVAGIAGAIRGRQETDRDHGIQIMDWWSPVEKADDPSVLPDFLDCDRSDSFYLEDTFISDSVHFRSEEYSVRYVAEEYVQRLVDRGYRICDTEETSTRSMDIYYWYLTHDDVGGSTVEGEAQVRIKHSANYFTSSGEKYTTVLITFGSGVTYGGEMLESGGSSSSGNYDVPEGPDYKPTVSCYKCDGDGDCDRCNGSGYVYYGTTRTTCPTCHGSRKCTTCGGSGKRK